MENSTLEMQPGQAEPARVTGTEDHRQSVANPAWLVALIGWSLLLSFYGLSGGAGFEPTDCWVGQTAREMHEANDWIVPRFSGETRMQKSPGPYWAVMVTGALRGEAIDEVATRIPNAIAAVALILTIYWLTRAIYGDRAAIFAGFAAASSGMLLYWSHRGASDLGLAALVTLSLGLFWRGMRPAEPDWRNIAQVLCAWLVAGLAMIYKMPMPLVCIGLPVGLYLLITRKWRWMMSPWHLAGLALFALPWLPWVLMVVQSEDAALLKWRVEFVDRFTGDLPNVEAQRHWSFYLLYLAAPFLFAIPYSLSIPNAFARAFRPAAGVDRDGVCFLLVWFFTLLAFFTLSVGKETRYFLPAMPPVLVLLGAELAAFFSPAAVTRSKWLRACVYAVWILTPLGFALGVLALRKFHQANPYLDWTELVFAYAVTSVVFSVGAGLSAWFYRQGRGGAAFGALVAAMWLTWLWAWPNLMPQLVSQKPFVDFAQQLEAAVPDALRSRVRFVATQDPRIIWHSQFRIPRVVDQLELLELQQGRRSIEREEEIIGERMIEMLSSSEPVLFVASRADYVTFLVKAPPRLAERGRTMPKHHLWLQTRIGPPHKHFVLFGNEAPDWPEPTLDPPSERLRAAQSAEAG